MMTATKVLDWFSELDKEFNVDFWRGRGATTASSKWTASVSTLLEAAFPPGHAILRDWASARSLPGTNQTMQLWERGQAGRGVFDEAYRQVRDGRVETLIDAIRVQSEEDVLDQADSLVEGSYLIAATVLGGGALETHLKRLCDRSQISVVGHGSIEKYNAAVGQARNQGQNIYEKADGSLVTAWGQFRNEAAHTPTLFGRSALEVRAMLAGIRDFINRTK